MVANKSVAKYELDLGRGTVKRMPKGEASLLKLWRSMAPAERSTTLGMLGFLHGQKRKTAPLPAVAEPQPQG